MKSTAEFSGATARKLLVADDRPRHVCLQAEAVLQKCDSMGIEGEMWLFSTGSKLYRNKCGTFHVRGYASDGRDVDEIFQRADLAVPLYPLRLQWAMEYKWAFCTAEVDRGDGWYEPCGLESKFDHCEKCAWHHGANISCVTADALDTADQNLIQAAF